MSSQPGTKISAGRAEEVVDDFASLPLKRHEMLPIQGRALALRNNFTAYDAFCVTLAELLGAPLLTGDRKFGRAVGHGAAIETWN